MKKLIAVSLLLALFTAVALPALSEGMISGGWAVTGDAAIPEEARAAFDEAIDGMVGSLLEPVALLGTQVVAGMNYCFLCRSTPVVPDPVPAYVLVYVYNGVSGAAEVLGIVDFDIAALSPLAGNE